MENDYTFDEKVCIKAQMAKSWEILHKYLWKLKCKYKISNNYLKIPDDLEKKFIKEQI